MPTFPPLLAGHVAEMGRGGIGMVYPLVNIEKAIENGRRNSVVHFPIQKW
jgi:hypothetical protein